MKCRYSRILIICDMEGSSGCFTLRASQFPNREWAKACMGMTLDVSAVTSALFDAGVKHVTIKDFHRTGHNLFTKLIDPRANIISGYKADPVPGVGDPGNAEAVIFLGMHAPSGSDGFIPHTLTSRVGRLTIQGKLISEVQLFAAALASYGIKPIFFSGCPVACSEAVKAIPWLSVFRIDKSRADIDPASWRKNLAHEAVLSLTKRNASIYNPKGPFIVELTMRDGEKAARKFADDWKLIYTKSTVFFSAADMRDVFTKLTMQLYLSPLLLRFIPIVLPMYNLIGKLGIVWAGIITHAIQRNRQSRG